MKYSLNPTRRYSKELASLVRSGRVDLEELGSLLDILARGNSLGTRYKDHELSKASPRDYQGCGEFYYKPNCCVVYKIESNQLQLLGIGPHNKLGLTESTICSGKSKIN